MLELVPLCTARIGVGAPLAVGNGAAGTRSIAPLNSADFIGERLTAKLAGPAAGDWFVQVGAVGTVDVRLTLRTHDDALLYVHYTGRMDAAAEGGPVARVAAQFEAGDERYAWLNAVQAVGKGRLVVEDGAVRLDYEFFELR